MDTAPDDNTVLPIPIDSLTASRLAAFARATNRTSTEAAAELLRDLLDDSDFWEAAATDQARRNLLN